MHAHSLEELQPHPYGDDFKKELCVTQSCSTPLTCRKMHCSHLDSHLFQVYDEEITVPVTKKHVDDMKDPNNITYITLLMTRFPSPHNYVRIMLRESSKSTDVVQIAHPLQRIVTESFVSLSERKPRPATGWWHASLSCTSYAEFVNGSPYRFVVWDATECFRCRRPYYMDTLYNHYGIIYSTCLGVGCVPFVYKANNAPSTPNTVSLHQPQQQQPQQEIQVNTASLTQSGHIFSPSPHDGQQTLDDEQRNQKDVEATPLNTFSTPSMIQPTSRIRRPHGMRRPYKPRIQHLLPSNTQNPQGFTQGFP